MNLYIETFGCQMNDRDSEIMVQLLEQAGYLLCQDIANADAIIVNTCSIRGKAEQKAYSLLGSLRRIKENHPTLIIAATGCVAQQEGKKMLSRMGHIDLVIGPQGIYDLPRLFADIRQSQSATSSASQVITPQDSQFHIPPFLPDLKHGNGHKRFVTIMQGCNNFCTYCIVPFARGREVSRSKEDIVAEASHLIDLGVKEITLLGQNVNSYGNDQDPEQRTTFAELLRAVAALPGLVRLRFTTSNPKDLSPALMDCFKDLPNLCHHFHLPLQSGSDTILSRMNRKYDRAGYLNLVKGLRQACPDLAITTDIIVGFPDESDDNFQDTMDLMEEVRYNAAFSFIYSNRPPARSCDFPDTISLEVKKQRLAIFQQRQKEISLERNQEYIGQIMELMVEGESKSGHGQWSGRAQYNQIVNFNSTTTYTPGDLVQVKITEGLQNSLRGELVES